jgi:hypothetical protein
MNTKHIEPIVTILTRPSTLDQSFLEHIIQPFVLYSPQTKYGQAGTALLDQNRIDVNASAALVVRLAKIVAQTCGNNHKY